MISNNVLQLFSNGPTSKSSSSVSSLVQAATKAAQQLKATGPNRPTSAQPAAKSADEQVAAQGASGSSHSSPSASRLQSISIRTEMLAGAQLALDHTKYAIASWGATVKTFEETGKVVEDGKEIEYDLSNFGGKAGYVDFLRTRIPQAEKVLPSLVESVASAQSALDGVMKRPVVDQIV